MDLERPFPPGGTAALDVDEGSDQSAEGSTLGCMSSIATPQHSIEPSPGLMQSTSVPHFSHWNRLPS